MFSRAATSLARRAPLMPKQSASRLLSSVESTASREAAEAAASKASTSAPPPPQWKGMCGGRYWNYAENGKDFHRVMTPGKAAAGVVVVGGLGYWAGSRSARHHYYRYGYPPYAYPPQYQYPHPSWNQAPAARQTPQQWNQPVGNNYNSQQWNQNASSVPAPVGASNQQ